MGYKEEYQRWLDKGIMVDELKALTDSEIEECFYKDLKFGTGGIRAIMGPGPNKLNKYTIRKNTEGFARSSAYVRKICEDSNIPYQIFVNHSDEPGGSTLGNISNSHVSIKTADIGLAQLAMHSSYEVAGIEDIKALRAFAKAFYEDRI